MPALLGTLRLAAVNIDGVLLNDTFSPVIHRFLEAHGVTYTRELERAVLSQPRHTAAHVLADAIGSTAGPQEIIEAYFAERERYLLKDPVRLVDGAIDLVRRLRGLGLDVVCYGGLDESHFERHIGAWRSSFTAPGYICTDGFRPGIREITQDRFGLGYPQVVFIDDAARVAERARELRVPFVGHPSPFRHGFQRQAMQEIGVRHLVHRLSDIDEALLHTLDREAAQDTVWQEGDRPFAGAGAERREERA